MIVLALSYDRDQRCDIEAQGLVDVYTAYVLFGLL